MFRNKKFKRSKKFKILVGIVALLVAARIALPYVLKYQINLVLKDQIPGYTGHIADLDLSLWRGAYQIEGLEMSKVHNKIPVPFFSIKETDLSIAWKPLLKGELVGKVFIDQARINFVNGKSPAQKQSGLEGGEKWQVALEKIFPLDIEEFKTRDSSVHFMDFTRNPKVDVYLYDLALRATNLRNTDGKKETLVSDVKLDGKIKKQGNLNIKGKANLLQDPPAFDYNLAVTQVDLTQFNDFFKAYGNFDIKTGRLDLYSEAASKKGALVGYAKPLLTNVDVIQGKEKMDSAKEFGMEIGSSFVNLVVRKYSKDQVGAKIPFDGTLWGPDVKVWPAVKSMFAHAFKKPLQPRVDGVIDIDSLKGRSKATFKNKDNKESKSPIRSPAPFGDRRPITSLRKPA